MRVNCSTCLELLTPGDDLSCTPCGHVFHYVCVMQWLSTGKKNCPQCRHKASENTLRRVFFSETDGETGPDADALQNQLDSARFAVRCKESERVKLAEKNAELEKQQKGVKEEVKRLEKELKVAKETGAGYKTQVRYLQEERLRYDEAKQEAAQLRNKLENYKAVEMVVKSCESDVNMMLHERGAFDGKSRDLATLVVTLKQKLADVKRERSAAETRARESVSGLDGVKRRVAQLSEELGQREERVNNLQADVRHLEQENEHLRQEIERAQRMGASQSRVMFGSPAAANTTPVKTVANSPDMFSPSPKTGGRANSPDIFFPHTKPGPPKYTVPGVKRVHSESSDDSPSLKSCGIIGMRLDSRRPLGEISDKKQKISSQPSLSRANSLVQHYDGFGGRSRLDEFPKPKTGLWKMKQPSTTSKSTKKIHSAMSKNSSNQKRTLDRFFGSLDSP